MPSQAVINAVAETIRSAGFRLFRSPTRGDQAGKMRYRAKAVDVKTGEQWSVSADSEYAALVDLAEQVGIELVD